MGPFSILVYLRFFRGSVEGRLFSKPPAGHGHQEILDHLELAEGVYRTLPNMCVADSGNKVGVNISTWSASLLVVLCGAICHWHQAFRTCSSPQRQSAIHGLLLPKRPSKAIRGSSGHKTPTMHRLRDLKEEKSKLYNFAPAQRPTMFLPPEPPKYFFQK